MTEQGTESREVEPATGLRRGADIAERLLLLAATIVRLARKLPRDVGGRHVASQLVRSGTSAGANYEEGRAAESRADFIHKLRVAVKEMRETIFWLSLVQRSAFLPYSASEPLNAPYPRSQRARGHPHGVRENRTKQPSLASRFPVSVPCSLFPVVFGSDSSPTGIGSKAQRSSVLERV